MVRPTHHPDHPHEPDHPHKPDPPHKPGHPHRPGHPHKPDHPHKPHHPHKPGRHRRGPKYTSDAIFKLPLSDSSLLFYSHGPFAYGGIKFYQDDSDSLNSDEVEVTINAKIWDKAALGTAKVCSLKRDHGAGLGIWTEHVEHENPKERQKHQLALGISVKFPKHPDTLEIKKLQTHMPLFAHLFEEGNFRVKDLEATTLFLPIKAEALSVDNGQLRTENSVIVGNFTATERLVLETRNSPIAVNVTLVNGSEKEKSGAEEDDFSKLFIKTSNSPIHGNISLLATTKDLSGGKFSVGAFTSNSPLHVSFADAPVDSVLRFIGLTSNSPAVAVMHPTFQGDFSVKSTLFGPKVDVTQDLKDPKGEGRTRTVDVSNVGREIVGKVYWGSEEKSKDAFGHAELSSTLLSATLKL
ncbi:hypothetical protein BDM02DRAFT_1058236 [Thelephora ganbajun]|uniref:Uncharacterized protein n=1 Tax=Thelephora ganbajun TaxID=370292 RepID=A0ACB6Z4A5_THEGA|nr:hypothetical protein BDM02DRAFT_1058236 [Thelephora ganbajun]